MEGAEISYSTPQVKADIYPGQELGPRLLFIRLHLECWAISQHIILVVSGNREVKAITVKLSKANPTN